FFIREGKSLIKIKKDDILFIKADNNYSIITTNEQDYILSSTLKKS
ncbi:MAG TPA: DNA-binding response regulator, partial [Flavobacteriales bacterium]|nr:DNA-binding response regulator [Flavobacteriales bacterium]